MDRRTFLASVSVLPVALSLGGCGDDQFPDYRYRMTVYVGDKPFSSVRAVLQEQVSSVADSSGQAVKRSEEHTSELQSLMRISYAVFCLKKKKNQRNQNN